MPAGNSMPLSKLLISLWRPSIPLTSPTKLASRGLQESCTRCFHFLIRLAWESRYRLPIMYAVFSFLFDIQMRLEINIHRERRLVLVEDEVEIDRDFDSESEEAGSELDDSEPGDSELLDSEFGDQLEELD